MVIWAIVLHCRSVPCLTNQDVLADNVLVSGDPADPESGAENFGKTSRARDVAGRVVHGLAHLPGTPAVLA